MQQQLLHPLLLPHLQRSRWVNEWRLPLKQLQDDCTCLWQMQQQLPLQLPLQLLAADMARSC